MRTLEQISPLAKEVAAKTRWRRMSQEELREKLGRLHSLIRGLLNSLPRPQPEPAPEPRSTPPVKELRRGKVTYRQERVKCGAKCNCNDGQGHGPYWYSYQREDGKLKKKYIGKELCQSQT
ncbi:MAG: DUF6788 family protein [Candidatus Bipolaricaulia bacterium]